MCMNRQECPDKGRRINFMEEKKTPVIRVKNLYKIYQVGDKQVLC